MAMQFRRKLYSRGGSYETTIPMQLLFSLDLEKPNDVLFEYDPKSRRWFLSVEQRSEKKSKRT